MLILIPPAKDYYTKYAGNSLSKISRKNKKYFDSIFFRFFITK